ncbi:hypothetical protein [Lawsonella clevelandensis]|uniref:hypothetical protein n=1 Tax=Lawsonella clevelandensis TaxID=1528099 RepID=UPI0032D9245A
MPNEFEPQYGTFPKTELTVYPSNGGVPGLKRLQSFKDVDLPKNLLGRLHSETKPFSDWMGSINTRLDEAQKKVDKAIADLGDGYDPGELTAYIDAEISKISALVSKNAADIASLAVASTDEIVKIVTDGMNGVMQGAAGAAGQVADAFATAFNRMAYALTGKNLGYWDAEIYVASSVVVEGFNDTPLGIVKDFNGKIKTLELRTLGASGLSGDTPSISVNILVNGLVKATVEFSGSQTKFIKRDLDIDFEPGWEIGISVNTIHGEYVGLSAMLAGVYL